MDGTAIERQSVLNERHRALGSDLSSSWNDMPIPQNYSTCPYAETEAVRNRAGLFDVSALKMVNVSGPDALAFLNHLLTTDLSKAKVGDSHISNIVNADGALIDDVLVYVDGGGSYRGGGGGTGACASDGSKSGSFISGGGGGDCGGAAAVMLPRHFGEIHRRHVRDFRGERDAAHARYPRAAQFAFGKAPRTGTLWVSSATQTFFVSM